MFKKHKGSLPFCAFRYLAVIATFAAASPLAAQVDRLRITRATNEVVIEWDAPRALLEAAQELAGPWTVLPEATSPYRLQPSADRRFYRLRLTGPVDTLRLNDARPLRMILEAVAQFQQEDRTASFTYFNGHVDSFSAEAKPDVPDYALGVLQTLELPIAPRQPLKLPLPVAAGKPRPGRDLDADFTRLLPILEETVGQPVDSSGGDDNEDELAGQEPPREERRTLPPIDPQRLVDWARPDADTLQREERAAPLILRNFLELHQNVFRVDAQALSTILRPIDYQVGAYFRKAVFEQFYEENEKLLYGRTLMHLDVNWNVIGLSRMIVTPEKLQLPAVQDPIPSEVAVSLAARVPPLRECQETEVEVVRAEICVDPIRRLRVWDVELVSVEGDCHWRTILDVGTGEILNVSDQVDRAFTDAKVNRYYYPGGDQMNPLQTVSTGIYTRNDRRLEHDFFYVMNDHRCEGDPEVACDNTEHSSVWCADAHGSYSGDSYIRATRRTQRDFDKYYPSGSSEAFAETHAYYWARSFSQWLKPSLDALGVLPSGAANYHRVLIITDACRSGSVHNSSYQVTTDDDKGERTNVIRLAHRNPAGPSNHNAGCQGGACFDNPSNIAHELNHFFLKRYYGVGSDLDCGSANQLQFTHEGILGTAVPQAYWDYYYGVGYNPPTDQLYFANSNIGRVHRDNATRMTIDNFLCVDYTDDPYRAGRVLGQALWEFYHGVKVDGSTFNGTVYPSTSTDFNTLVYWAADLQASSTYKDRYEFANRIMEILDKHSNWSSHAKEEYCEIFEHHAAHWFINDDYCQ